MEIKMNDIIDKQRAFFLEGHTRPVDKRLKYLKRLKEIINEHAPDIEAALWDDLHKSSFEAYVTETSIVLSEIGLYLKYLRKWAKTTRVSSPLFMFPSQSRIVKEPYGLVLIIAPWNYPFQLLMAPLVAAIAAGNVVAVKPSEDAPATAKVVEKILHEVFEKEYVSVFQGDIGVSTALLKQRFDYIFFTGSPRVGRVVMEAAVPNLTPVTLELGGKSPCIVDKSADLKTAARRIAWGKFINAGQTCIAPDYLFVHTEIRSVFIKEIIEVIKEFYGEDALKSTDYPRIITEKAYNRLIVLLEDSMILYGGNSEKEERYIEPTLIECCSLDHPVMKEEIFGPILPILEMQSIDEAIAYINSHDKPLALYYFGNNQTARRVISETSSGGACINDTILHVANPKLPFGGVGESGMGSYHGPAGFDTFTHQRSVLVSKTWIDFKIKYPPYKGLKWMKKLM